MKAVPILAVALLIVGCSTPVGSGSQSDAMTPSASSTVSAPASLSPGAPESATDLLDCDGPVSPMGGRADEFGPNGAGSTPDEAFAEWMEINPFTVPRSGYRSLGSIGDRSVYAYETGGRIKVIVVISPRFSALVGGAAFTIEEMRTCDPSEYGATVDMGPHQRV
ncbi:MAG: hypothetical protein M3406_12195, partial [Chloroflexota bacterium]|nr:hypothetical protein [Chloroflexota bacterium]